MPKRPPLHTLGQSGAADGEVPVWDDTLNRWVPGTNGPTGGPFVIADNLETLSSRNDAPTGPAVGDLWYDADETATVDAVDVTVTPAGDIAATDLQAALEELDAEKSPAGHTHALDDLSDVTAPGPAEGDALVWNGTAWVPGEVASAPTTMWVPLTTVEAGEPVLVWDENDNLVIVEVPL